MRQKFALDMAVWTTTAILAFVLRLPHGWIDEWRTMLLYAAVTLPIQAVLIIAFRLHHQAWGQVSLRDAFHLAVGCSHGNRDHVHHRRWSGTPRRVSHERCR